MHKAAFDSVLAKDFVRSVLYVINKTEGQFKPMVAHFNSNKVELIKVITLMKSLYPRCQPHFQITREKNLLIPPLWKIFFPNAIHVVFQVGKFFCSNRNQFNKNRNASKFKSVRKRGLPWIIFS